MPRHWQAFLIALLFFALVAAMLLNKALLPGYTILPLDLIQTINPWDRLELGPLANPLISDPFYSFYPRRLFLTESIRAGTFPLWNPGIMTGTPTIANPNFQPFYPPNLLAALILPAHRALPWLAWFHLTLTGALMYLLLRRHRLHWLACTMGGGVWLLNGYTLVWLENPHRLSTIAWIPGIFWAYEAATQEHSAGRAALGGLLLGLTILGGQMQFVFGLGLMLGTYALVKLILTFQQGRRWPVQQFLYLGLVGLIGLGIGALILLPAAEFAGVSQRVRFSAGDIQQTRWPLSQLVTLIAPDFYGNPTGLEPYWGPVNYAEMTAYFGVVALLLALMAPFIAPRKPFIHYTLGLAVVTLLIILGTPVARLLLALPGAQFVPLARMLFLIPLAGTLLAAGGLDGWLTAVEKPDWRRRLVPLIGVLTTIVGVILITTAGLGNRFAAHRDGIMPDLARSVVLLAAAVALLLLMKSRYRLAGVALSALAMVDLLSWGLPFNPIISTDYLYPDNEVTQWLKQDGSLYRVLPLQSGKVVFGPNVLTVFGMQEIGGYTPLIQERYRRLFKTIDDRVDIWWMAPNNNMLVLSHFDPLVSLLNVKYVLSAEPLPFEIIPQAGASGCDAPVSIGDTRVTHTFRASDPGLNRVDLTFVAAGGAADLSPGDEPVRFRLWREPAGSDVVADIGRAAADLSLDGPQPFFFAPVPDSAGQTFTWEISGPANLALCQSSNGLPQFSAYATWLQPAGEMDGVWVYENPNVLPRAFVVHHVVERPSDQVLETIQDPGFNWYHSGVVEMALPEAQRASLSETPRPGTSRATVTHYGLQAVDIAVSGDEDGFLILSDAYYPGWSATVDDQQAPIYRANYTMRGVFVPAGDHQVTFRFWPATLTPALIVAGSALLVAGLAIGFDRFKKES